MRRFIVLAVAAVAACANLADIRPGASREQDVAAKFGRPAAEYRLPDGSRALDYPREPEGMENWRVVIGPDGTVRSVEQLVDEPTFARILPGLTRDQVLQMLGPITEEERYANLGEDVLSWRYLEFGGRRMFFNAHLDRSGRLRYTTRSPDSSETMGSDNSM